MCSLHLSLCGIYVWLSIDHGTPCHKCCQKISLSPEKYWKSETCVNRRCHKNVMSCLDYCNALLIGIQQDLIAKLQRLQNSAARIVSRTRKYEHITPVLIKFHWLPIKFRIQFKVLLLVYKALNGLAPKYIKELLVPDAIYDQKQRAFWMSLGLDSNLEIALSPLVHRDYGMRFHNTWRILHRVRPSRSVSKHTFSGSPIEALLTMTQTMTMCSAFEHFMNGNGAI